VGRLKFQGAAE
jgi:Protein of unknown function (DUF1761)